MKNLLLLCCILLGIANAQAQGKVEIKANLLGVFESAIGLSGEYLLAPQWGIEAGVGYQAYKYVDFSYLATVKSKYVNTFISGKYYFKPRYGGDRFFLGVVADYFQFLSRTRAGQEIEKPDNALGVGIEPGIKVLVKERLIIEFGARVLLVKDVFEDTDANINLIINGKIGYRFNKK